MSIALTKSNGLKGSLLLMIERLNSVRVLESVYVAIEGVVG